MRSLYILFTERIMFVAATLLTVFSVALGALRMMNAIDVLYSVVLVSLAASVILWILYVLHRTHFFDLIDSIQFAAFSLLLFVSLVAYNNPFGVREMWALFVIYLLVISFYQSQKMFLVWSGACFFAYGFIVFSELRMMLDVSTKEQLVILALYRASLMIGGMLLAFLVFSYSKKLKMSVQVQQAKKERKQLYRMVHALVPVVERKTQTSRDEIETMHVLMKSMLRALRSDVEEWELRMIVLLHYVSRIKWPDYFFDKEGKLTDFEYQMVKEHCFFAKEFLPDEPAYRRIIDALSFHHERVDGTGYPHCLTGDKIPLLSQVLGIAECYIALVSPRSYRGMVEAQDALSEIRLTQGTAFAEDIIEALAETISMGSVHNSHEQSLPSKVGLHPLKSG
ncbi:UNVERIFIED_CONTAM: hypothetical protein ABID98_000608 [Brevibacillus sp. OAP136]